MPVTVKLANGTEQDFQAGATAYHLGGFLLIVAKNGEELAKFDSSDVAVAVVTDERGVTVETVPGRPIPN